MAAICSVIVALVGLGVIGLSSRTDWTLILVYPLFLVFSLVLGGVGLTSRAPALGVLGILLTLSPVLLLAI